MTTSRLLLRPWIDSDLARFAELNADPEVMRYFPAPLTREQSDALAARIRSHIDELGWGLWAVEVTDADHPLCGRFIGFVGLSVPRFTAPFMPATEIGWRLSHAAWGHGFATEAATVIADHAFRRLALAEVVSMTTAGNLRSRAVMERIGMTRDPADDFDHPGIEPGHPLRRHVLYRLRPAGLDTAAGGLLDQLPLVE